MLRPVAFVPTLWFCLVAAAAVCPAATTHEITSFAPVVDQVQRYADAVGGERVLVVMDIDNTLLAMDRQLGSDQWFEWQSYLLEHQSRSPHLVADDFEGLLAAQGLLFATQAMHPPEPSQPQMVATIQALDAHTLVLTSRGDAFRTATLRELTRNGYEVGRSAPPIRLLERDDHGAYETCTRFYPYRTDRPTDYGLTASEVELFALAERPRQVSYGDGVFMVAGQHKGAMLLVLLHLVEHEYRAIVYVDDHLRHVHHVYDALVRRGIEVSTFHYQHQQPRVEAFQYGDKAAVSRQWRSFERAVAPSRRPTNPRSRHP